MKFKLVESFEDYVNNSWYVNLYQEYAGLVGDNRVGKEAREKISSLISTYDELEPQVWVNGEYNPTLDRKLQGIRMELVDTMREVVAQSKNIIDKSNVARYIDKYIIGMSTSDIISSFDSIVSSDIVEGATFILPNGDQLSIKKVGQYDDMHIAILITMVKGILEKKTQMKVDIDDDFPTNQLYNYLLDDLCWIKANTGTGAVDNKCYFVGPSYDGRKPTNSQYYKLEDLIDLAKTSDKKFVSFYGGMNGKFDRFDLERTANSIVKSIRRFYSSGYFVEKQLHEVYPNKGESKEDFISRFMSVTKDEYPDTKQRYAIALSYWDRRNKKKVNESQESDTLQKLIDFFGVTDRVPEDATYILPNGKFMYTIDREQEMFDESEHLNIVEYLNSIGIKDENYFDASKFMYDLGAIRVNAWFRFITLHKDKRPTFEQYEAIEKYLYALDRNKFAYNRDFVTVYIPPHTNQKYFFDLGDTPEEIVKKIKRYYSSGVLYESSDDKETSYRGVDSLNESVTKIDSNKSKATTKDGREFTIWTETNDSHGGELYKMKIAYVGDNWMDENDKVIKDNLLGYVDYNVYEDKAYINFIKVKDSEKRKGVGTALIQSLYDDHKEVIWGYTTEDGSELKKYIDSIK